MYLGPYRLHCHVRYTHKVDPTTKLLLQSELRDSSITCRLCELNIFLKYDELDQHVTAIHGVTLFKCDKCDHIVFGGKDRFEEHMEQIHNSEVTNKKVKKKQKRPKYRNIHRRLILPPPDMEVSPDKKSKSDQTDSQKEYICFFCSSQWDTNADLVKHLSSHTASVYKCPYCPKECRTHMWNFFSHIRAIHKIDPKTNKSLLSSPQSPKKNLQRVDDAIRQRYRVARRRRLLSQSRDEPASKKSKLDKGEDISSLSEVLLKYSTVLPTTSVPTSSVCQVRIERVKLNEHDVSDITKINYLTPRVCKCFWCREKLADHRMYVRHMKTQHPSIKFCNKCCGLMDSNSEHFCEQTVLVSDEQDHSSDKVEIEPAEDNDVPSNWCKMCEKSFSTFKSLKHHNSAVHGSFDAAIASFVCNICPAMFVLEMSLSKHKTNIHDIADSRRFECLRCQVKFENLPGVHGHLIQMHKIERNKTFNFYRVIEEFPIVDQSENDELDDAQNVETEKSSETSDTELSEETYQNSTNSASCKICKVVLSCAKKLRRHMNTVHKNDSYRCYICNVPYSSKQALGGHIHSAHSDIPFDGSRQCEICKKFIPKYKFGHHMKTVHDSHSRIKPEPNRKCSICEVKLISKEDRKRHEKTVHANDFFKCYLCEIPFATLLSLTPHLSRVHPEHELKLKNCDDCDEPIPLELLSSHIIRCNRNDFVKAFSGLPSNVLQSDEAHGSIPCTICEARYISDNNTDRQVYHFASEDLLKGHIARMHKEHDMFYKQCSICKKSISKQLLESHIQSHSVVLVDKEGAIQTSNKESMLIHQEQRDPRSKISCTVCEMTFRVDNLKRHMETVHANDSYRCYLCQVPFATRHSLSNHISRVHPEHKMEFEPCGICNRSIPKQLFESHSLGHSLDPEKEELIEVTEVTDVTIKTRNKTRDIPIEGEKPAIPKSADAMTHMPQISTVRTDSDHAEEIDNGECPICHVMPSKGKLKRHIANVHANGTHICSVCDAPFVSLRTMKSHIRIMHSDNSSILHSSLNDSNPNITKFSTRTDRWNARHRKYAHSDDEDAILDVHNSKCYFCSQCTTRTRYKKKRSLRDHLRYFHKIDPEIGVDVTADIEKESKCQDCNKSIDPRFYKSHMKKMHDVVQNTGRKCSKQFSPVRGKSQVHSDKTLPAPKIVCELCNKPFSCAAALLRHNNTIHGVRDPMQECEYCKKLTSRNNSARHLRDVHGIGIRLINVSVFPIHTPTTD